jgi:hypothetical protein
MQASGAGSDRPQPREPQPREPQPREPQPREPQPREPQRDEPLLRLRQADLAARAFRDETVVLDLRDSTYLATNPTGSLLWRLLERGARRSELVAALVDEFEVDEQTAAPDVDAFLAECRQRELLEEPAGS